MKIHFAPIQGHTDAAYRHAHAGFYTPADFYYSPFIRWEKGGVRPRDLRDIDLEANEGFELIPQIIFRDRDELRSLAETIYNEGFRRIDINMGCPFPMQTGKGRGAALVANDAMAREVAVLSKDYADVEFSVKMRLGLKNPDEWKITLPILNEASLRHITIHPRVAAQQYGGEVDLEMFAEFLKSNNHKTVYNGDLRTPSDVAAFVARFPEVDEIMIGRGLLARPSLVDEVYGGKEWSRQERIERMLRFHRSLLSHYRETLCGDAQVLDKIKPFWEYSEEEIGRKPWKAIKKSINMAKYTSAVALVNPEE